jgi:hypothetical protein
MRDADAYRLVVADAAVHANDEHLVSRVVLEKKVLHPFVIPARTKSHSPAMPSTIFQVSM